VSDAVRAAEQAHHWFEARQLPEALEASVTAGLGADRVGALPEAARHFERALEIWPNVPAADERLAVDQVDVTLRTITVNLLMGNFNRGRSLCEQALQDIDVRADPLRAAMLYERLGRARWDMDDNTAIDAYEEAVRIVPSEPPTSERALVLAAHGQILMLQGRFTDAIAACEQAIEVAKAAGARQPEGHARNTLGCTLAGIGRDDEGIVELQHALAIAHDVDNVEDIGRAYINLTESLNKASRFAESIEIAFEGLEQVRRYGIDRTVGVYLTSNLVDALWVTGRWEEALEQAEAIVARRPEGHWNYFTPGSLLAETGRFEEAAAVLSGVTLPEGGEAMFQGLADHADAIAALSLWQGRPEEVAAGIQSALDQLPESYQHDRGGALFWRLTWASADLAERARARHDEAAEQVAIADAEHAHAVLAELVGRPGEHGSRPTLGCAAHVALAAAEVTRARGEPDPDAWRRTRAEWEHLDVIYRASYARFREAEARLATGDRDGAREVLDGLSARVRELGAEPLAQAVDALATRAGLAEVASPPASAVPANGPALTRRERQVLGLVTEGLSNGQIAERLFISTKTASVHVSNILAKLGVSSRTEAAALAVRDGLVDEPVG
jgi:ATP/maltotriose-dependent transcriptional regulator MalT